MRVRLICGLACALSVSACRPSALVVTGPLSPVDVAAIRATSEKWMAAARLGRWEEVASTYTDDAVLWFPDRTVVGRQAILADFQRARPFSTMELFITEIEGRGDLAFVSGYSTVVRDGQTVRQGKYLDIRKRQPDGSWLFYRDMVNTPDK